VTDSIKDGPFIGGKPMREILHGVDSDSMTEDNGEHEHPTSIPGASPTTKANVTLECANGHKSILVIENPDGLTKAYMDMFVGFQDQLIREHVGGCDWRSPPDAKPCRAEVTITHDCTA
jgi:hypothetical protein